MDRDKEQVRRHSVSTVVLIVGIAMIWRCGAQLASSCSDLTPAQLQQWTSGARASGIASTLLLSLQSQVGEVEHEPIPAGHHFAAPEVGCTLVDTCSALPSPVPLLTTQLEHHACDTQALPYLAYAHFRLNQVCTSQS